MDNEELIKLYKKIGFSDEKIEVLYRISEAGGSDYDFPNSGMDLPKWTLKECDANGGKSI